MAATERLVKSDFVLQKERVPITTADHLYEANSTKIQICSTSSRYRYGVLETLLLAALALLACLVQPGLAADQDVCTIGRTQWNPTAVARFGLSLSLRKWDLTQNRCGQVSQEVLQLYVAAQWVLERLNNDTGNGSYVPGVQFGFDLLDDCRSPTRAVQYALDFVELDNECRAIGDNSSTVLRLGLVGPTRSSTAEETADSMRTLPIPIISPSATLASLTEGATPHPNFFRTAPSDNLQIEVIVSILKQQRWTFVAVVYTNDNYGTMGARTLQRQAAVHNICVNASLPIFGDIAPVVRQLVNMRDRAEGRSLAVVYIGEKDKAENLIFFIRTQESYGFHFIMSDSVSTNSDVFKIGKVRDTNIGLGSLTLAPSNLVFQDFEDYLNQRFRNVQNGRVTDPQIDAYLKSVTWRGERVNQIPFVPLVVGAVFALVEATRLAHLDRCKGNPGVCPEFIHGARGGDILNRMKNITVDFGRMSASVAPARFKSMGYVLEFDQKGDVVPKPELPDYTVFAYDDNDRAPYLNVGSSNGGNLTLDMSKVRMLTSSGQITTVQQTSVCSGSCMKCAADGRVPLAHIPGAAYIIGVFSIHERISDEPFKCGDFRNVSSDAIVLEAFLHAVRQIRQTTGMDFGAVAFDDCYSPLYITSVLSDFLSGLVPDDKALFDVCVPRDKVVGVVGSLSSDSTMATASFFTPLRTPVISYASSSPDLDDRVNYPYFLRTVPSDEEQARAMVEIVFTMGWEYVGLLHVSNNYGTKGARAFQRLAAERRICVAKPVVISPEPGTYDETDLDNAFREFIKSGVKVVVFFGIDTRMASMLRLIESRSDQGRIVFLASEEWADKKEVLDAGPKAARGSITLKLNTININTAVEQSLYDSLIKRTPTRTDPNPWFGEFWQHVFDCNLPGGFNNIFHKECSDSDRLSSLQVKSMLDDQRVKHVINAVHVLGEALLSARAEICEETFPCPFLRKEDYAKKVLGLIRSQTITVGSAKERVFDENGNGVIGFTIFNIQRTAIGYKYQQVGTYNRQRGLQFDKSTVQFYTDTGIFTAILDASCGDDRCAQCVFPSEGLPTPEPVMEEKDFRVADLIILIVLLAVCILLVCGMIFGFAYFRRKVKGLSKELQETKKEPVYHEAQEPRVYGNVNSERSFHALPAPPPCGPAPTIRFVNSLDSRGPSPADTLDGHTNPAFRSDSTGLHMMNAYSEQSLNQNYPAPPPRPHRTPDPPARQNSQAPSRPNAVYVSDPGMGNESEGLASSQHNYYMAHSLSSVRELPAVPGSAPVISPQSGRRTEHIPLRSLSNGNSPYTAQQQRQQQQQQYLHACELDDPVQKPAPQYGEEDDMNQIQYFRMTPSGQLEEGEGEEEEEEEMAALNTYSLSPPLSQTNVQYGGGDQHSDKPYSFSPNNYIGNMPHVQITPEIRQMLLQQLAENLLQQQHHQQQQQQQQYQQNLKQPVSALQSPSSSSMGSSCQGSVSSKSKRRQLSSGGLYQEERSLVYPSSSSMSDNLSRAESGMGSSHSSQPNFASHTRGGPQYYKQTSTPAGSSYPTDHQSLRAARNSQPARASVQQSSPYAQLANVQQGQFDPSLRSAQHPDSDTDPASGMENDSSGTEQEDNPGSLGQASPHVRWTLDSLESVDAPVSDESVATVHQGAAQHRQHPPHRQKPAPIQQQRQQQQHADEGSDEQSSPVGGAPLHITRV